MNGDHFVIDASVAIKWVVDEPGTEQAVVLRRKRLFAPDLLIAVCANILWKKVRRRELSDAEAILAARLLHRADIQLEPMRRLLENTRSATASAVLWRSSTASSTPRTICRGLPTM
jgi:predicted nucleic acid-binding protein